MTYEWKRVGFDVEYVYDTEGSEVTLLVTSEELISFISENRLADKQTDVDNFIKGDAWDFLMGDYEEIVKRYWDEELNGGI